MFPTPRPGRPRKDACNHRIAELLTLGFGVRRIHRALKAEGADIGATTVGARIRELRRK